MELVEQTDKVSTSYTLACVFVKLAHFINTKKIIIVPVEIFVILQFLIKIKEFCIFYTKKPKMKI